MVKNIVSAENSFEGSNIGCKMKKILVVCACNLNRSPAVEKYLKEHFPKYEIKSAGTLYGYPNKLDDELIDWADKIYVMDLSQTKFIFERWPQLRANKVETIGLSDQYSSDDRELIELIDFWAHCIKKGIV